MGRVFHGPGDLLVSLTSARDRRSFGAWTLIVSVALYPVFGGQVFYVSALSVLALIPNVSAETPVEQERDE
jgi:hypothetical protein